jgi:RNA polymerase sigma-70 factor (ECF subfamily)
VNSSDAEIVERIRLGDPDAFAELVGRHQRRLFGLILMMVRDPSGAEDVTQETFVRAYVHLDHFDVQRACYPWLASIAVRLSQNWLRKYGRTTHREGTALDDAQEPSSADHRLLTAIITDERDRELWHAVSMLPSGERTAVVLYYRDDMPVQDVARALGVTTGTVKTLLFRARRHLRQRLGASQFLTEEVSK